MNVDWIAGHHLPGNTHGAGRGRERAAVGTRPYTVTIIRMAITVAAAIHARGNYLRCYTHTDTVYIPYTPRAPRARKSTRIPGNRLRCAAPAGIEFIIPLGTAPLPDHFRVFAFHGTDRHVPARRSNRSFSISYHFRPRCASRI